MFKNVVIVSAVVVMGFQSIAIVGLHEQNKDNAEKVAQATQRAQDKKLVYQVCQDSRIDDKTSENACGEVQDRLSVEYLCKENNNKETNKCWTEAK